jgi:hypothetical protein
LWKIVFSDILTNNVEDIPTKEEKKIPCSRLFASYAYTRRQKRHKAAQEKGKEAPYGVGDKIKCF